MSTYIRCPKCGGETRLRIRSEDGKKFYVCERYPKCKGRIECDEQWENDSWKEERTIGKRSRVDDDWSSDAGLKSRSPRSSIKTPDTDSCATASLVLGIIGIFIVGIVLGPIAIGLAISAKKKMKRNLRIKGEGQATAGLILGIVDTSLYCIAIVAGVIVMTVGGVFGTSQESAYAVTKDELKNAVADYASRNSGNLPYNYGNTITITGVSGTTYIINISALLTSAGGILSGVPDSCAQLLGNDNCDDGSATCHSNAHYVWATDQYGNVYSKCIGSECDSNADGYQGVYP